MIIIFKDQVWHLLFLLISLTGINYLTQVDMSYSEGELFGIQTSIWFLFALLSPILHQVYVLICWRVELYYKSISKTFGNYGFLLFKVGFAILILSRPVTICFLAFSNKNTLNIDSVYAYILAFVLFIPACYLFYSVKRYFGIDRAFGIDHFQPELMKNKPFIKGGIFKFTSNGMYIYGFLLLYIPGFLLLSKAALLLAIFNHIYIWVHYYFTELPDIKVIYGDQN